MSIKKKVFLAVLAYDWKIDIMGMLSIFNNIKDLETHGWTVDLNIQAGNCYVDAARNKAVDNFLKTDISEFVFIDNDLAFDNDAIRRLLNHPVQAIGGAYPYRTPEQNGYPVKLEFHPDGVPKGDPKLGIIETSHVPTGLLRIRRDVFEKFAETYPNFKDDKGERLFFRTGILFESEGDYRWFGEDVAFCEYCRRMGITVWCEPRINFMHIGRLPKGGNFHNYLIENAKPKAN